MTFRNFSYSEDRSTLVNLATLCCRATFQTTPPPHCGLYTVETKPSSTCVLNTQNNTFCTKVHTAAPCHCWVYEKEQCDRGGVGGKVLEVELL